MTEIDKYIDSFREKSCALYGLGTETERFISKWGNVLSIVGLLDGFREDGELYGYPILSLQKVIDLGVKLIIVIARPGSCKEITKRIGEICRENEIELFDVRGCNLLETTKVSYGFSNVNGKTESDLYSEIDKASVISFDLFDTLVTRNVYSYTDVFELLESKLDGLGVTIPSFAKLRLQAEKERSVDYAPNLKQIYEHVLNVADISGVSAEYLSNMEWELDFSLMIAREKVCDILKYAVESGKYVTITTDTYYSKEQIEQILEQFNIKILGDIFVSCEEGVSKAQGLFKRLIEKNVGETSGILHIGDDEFSDVECAGKYNIRSFRIFKGSDLFDMLGGLGLESGVVSVSDRVKLGLFISTLLNDPFTFEKNNGNISVNDAFDLGYLFCAPMISDFTLWLQNKLVEDGISQILFSARDGFLIDKLFKSIGGGFIAYYFLTSRTAAIRAGVMNGEDLAYVDAMKYFGSDEDNLKVRFGIEASEGLDKNSRNDMILCRSKIIRDNYLKYIDGLGMEDKTVSMFDFVAKGTSQLYLQRLFSQHIKGYYFLQLEPEFMADKGLDIEPFYSDEEKNTSAIFDNYYILETILTSPDPQLLEFDQDGNPIYADETRSNQDITTVERVQKGIIEYFEDYIRLVPESCRNVNKRLDEKLLALFNHIQIKDGDFMNLKVEDPFFGRMTDIKDVIG